MKLHAAPAILSVAMIATLLLPAGALVGTMGAPSEDVFDGEPSVEMAAHDGPNGAYVETAGDGKIEIDVTDPGVNAEALTDIERVFDLTNTDSTNVTVWVTHDGNENIRLYDDETDALLDSASGAVVLAPGERITVSIAIDSRGVGVGQKLLSTVTLHAEFSAEPTTPGAGGGAGPSEPVEPTQPIDPDADVDVVFDDGGDSGTGSDTETRVRSVDVSELDTDPAEDVDRPPLAVINSDDAETRADDPSEAEPDTPDAEAFDVMTLVGEPVELSGERSTIGAAEAVTNRDRITRLVDIEVSPERTNQPATVRMRVDRDRLDDVQAERTMIGHRTEEGWELLETRVVERTDTSVVVEARTPGFSMFAVFSPPDVKYKWELSDGTELEGDGTGLCVCTTPTFDEPGFHDVQLTVTDRFGRQSSATHRVLANDVPSASIEVVERDGNEVTLAANVTDEVGETEVTWTFPDGTEMTGEEVTHELEEGEHEIGLHVVDEYGAESETEATVAVGPPGASAEMVSDALGMDLELLAQVGLLSVVGLVVGVGYRQFPWGVFRLIRRRGPEIRIAGLPIVDAEAGRIEIESLTVRDPSSAIDTITIEVVDDDDRTVVEKRLDISGVTEYTATPETLVVPPGISLGVDESYTVQVEATTANGQSAGQYSATTAAPADDIEQLDATAATLA